MVFVSSPDNNRRREKQTNNKNIDTMAVAQLKRCTQTSNAQYSCGAYRCGVPTVVGACMQTCHRHCNRQRKRFAGYNRHCHCIIDAYRDIGKGNKPLDKQHIRCKSKQPHEAGYLFKAVALRMALPAKAPHRRFNKQVGR